MVKSFILFFIKFVPKKPAKNELALIFFYHRSVVCRACLKHLISILWLSLGILPNQDKNVFRFSSSPSISEMRDCRNLSITHEKTKWNKSEPSCFTRCLIKVLSKFRLPSTEFGFGSVGDAMKPITIFFKSLYQWIYVRIK